MTKLTLLLLAFVVLAAPLVSQELSVYLEPSRAITAIADARTRSFELLGTIQETREN